MSFWDKVSEGAHWVERTAGTVGGAVSYANHIATDAPVVGGFIGGAENVAGTAFHAGVIQPIDTIGAADAWVYNNLVNRPLSTALQVGFDKPFWEMGPGQQWSDAWKKSEKISWGQALTTDINGDLDSHQHSKPGQNDFSMTTAAQATRSDYFSNTWQGKYSSGTFDLVGNVMLDPLVGVGKVGAGIKAGRNIIDGAEELNRAMTVAKDGSQAVDGVTRHEGAMGQKIQDIVTKHTEGVTALQMSAQPWFRKTSNGGTFAYLMDYANQKFADDAATRFKTKQQILGAMLGHKPSIDALRAQQTALGAEVDALLKPPSSTVAYGTFTFDDAGKAVWEGANAEPIPDHVYDQAKEIDQQIGRLAQVVGDDEGRGAGTLKSLGGSPKVRQSYLLGGYASKPIRIVSSKISDRLPGYISTVNTQAGFADLKTYLQKAIHLDADEKTDLLNQFLAAGTRAARNDVLRDAADRVNDSIAAKYGVNPLTAKAIQAMGDKTSDVIRRVIKSRMYSTATLPDGSSANHVLVHDPFEGEYVAIPRPLSASQMENAVVMADPLQLDKVYRTYYQHRYLDHIPKIGTPLADGLYGPIKDATEMVLHAFTSVWKFTTLLNLGYPLRILADTVLRPNIYMSPVNYWFRQMPQVARAVGKTGASDASAVGDLLKGDTGKVMTQFLRDMGHDDADISDIMQNISSSGGSLADVASESADRIHGKIMGTGSWAPVKANEPGHAAAYARAVNQVRVSPILMAAVRGLEGDGLKNFIRTDQAAGREWLEIRHANENDMDQYVARAEAHVNALLPSNDARAWVAGNDVPDAAEGVAGYKEQRLPSKRKLVPNPNKPGKKMLVPNPRYDEIVKLNSNKLKSTLQTLSESPGARGKGVTDELIKQWYPEGTAPTVHGESFNPVKADTPVARTMTLLGKLRSGYYRWAGEGPENLFGRMPLYRFAFHEELNRILMNMGEEATTKDLTLARRSADMVARKAVTGTMYDAMSTSRLSSSMKYVMPFYSAWEDTMRKYGNLFLMKPWAPVRIANAWTSPNRNGQLQDEYGNTIQDGVAYAPKTHRKLDPTKDLVGNRRMVTLPLNWLPKNMQAVAETTFGVTGEKLDVNSINSIFQGDPWLLPGTGPLVQVAVDQFVKNAFPEAEDNNFVKWVLPFGTSDNDLKTLLPAKWVHVYDAAFGDSKDFEDNLKNVIAYDTEMYLQGKGPRPNIEDESTKARLFTILKAGINFASPVRVEPDAEGQFYIDQAKIYQRKYTQDPAVKDQYIKQYGQKIGLMKYDSDHPSWQQKFHEDFPQFFLMGSSLSANQTGIVATIKASQTAMKYGTFIKENPEWGWAIVGPDNAYGQTPDTLFSQAANNVERREGFRGAQQGAQAAVDKMQTDQGWIQYNAAATKINLALAKSGLTIDDPAAAQYKTLLSQYAKAIGRNNAPFLNDFNSMNTQKSMLFLKKIFDAVATYPDLKNQPHIRAVGQYAQARNKVIAILAQRPYHSLTAKSNADLANIWNQFTTALLANNIGFEAIYNRVLAHDSMNIMFDNKSDGGIGQVIPSDDTQQQP